MVVYWRQRWGGERKGEGGRVEKREGGREREK